VERTSGYFRDLNERIARTAADIGFEGFVPLICECVNPRCFRLVRTTLQEFDELRAHPGRLVLFPGHEGAVGDCPRADAPDTVAVCGRARFRGSAGRG
jgi:hypothetical protein